MYWVTFVGEGRSGHTIVSAILGSHPHIRMGEEQKYISKWYRNAWSREKILAHLLQSGEGNARRQLQFPGILTYKEPLLVVGDKCGWDAVNEYRKRQASKDIITQFGTHMDMPVKTIVTLRHPLDNISAWVMSPKYIRMFSDDNLRYRRMIRRYKRFHEAAVDILENQDIFYLHNEALIADPKTTIIALSDWLGLLIDYDWVEDCASKVFDKPNKRRDKLNWPIEYEQRVLDFINVNPMLKWYR